MQIRLLTATLDQLSSADSTDPNIGVYTWKCIEMHDPDLATKSDRSILAATDPASQSDRNEPITAQRNGPIRRRAIGGAENAGRENDGRENAGQENAGHEIAGLKMQE